MPAKSKKQQMAAGAALAAKRGEIKKSKLKGASKQMAKSMSKKQLKEFASTKRKKLPKKKKSNSAGGRGEQLADFIVRGLRKVFVELPDSMEVLGRDCANRLVHFLLEFPARIGRADRNGDDNFTRFFLAQSRRRRAHARPRREAVVHQNDNAPPDLQGRAIIAVFEFAALQLSCLTTRHRFHDFVGVRLQCSHHILVQNPHAT